MRLRELAPQFLQWAPGSWKHVDTIAESQGILFLCPKCFIENNGDVGTHSVICWFADSGVPPDETPGPGRWRPGNSTGYDDLTFVGPDPTSVQLTGGCGWHGHITNGEVTLS